MTPAHLCPALVCLLLQMRDTVRQVAHLFPTAIISGRGRDKVEAFVQLPELFYAGSHGMDIAGPRVSCYTSLLTQPQQKSMSMQQSALGQ